MLASNYILDERPAYHLERNPQALFLTFNPKAIVPELAGSRVQFAFATRSILAMR